MLLHEALAQKLREHAGSAPAVRSETAGERRGRPLLLHLVAPDLVRDHRGLDRTCSMDDSENADLDGAEGLHEGSSGHGRHGSIGTGYGPERYVTPSISEPA